MNKELKDYVSEVREAWTEVHRICTDDGLALALLQCACNMRKSDAYGTNITANMTVEDRTEKEINK